MRLHFHNITDAYRDQPDLVEVHVAAADGDRAWPLAGTRVYVIYSTRDSARASRRSPYTLLDPDGYTVETELPLKHAITAAEASASARALLPHAHPICFVRPRCVEYSRAA